MIGVFDSGVGGLTVVKEIFKELPEKQIIYFGDTARLPYGTKGAEFVKRYSRKITKWLLDKGAKIIIVACHTASARASDYLRKEFKNVFIFDMASAAKEDILGLAENKKIGIIGTPGTIKSGSYEKQLLKLNHGLKIYSQDCPLFVPLVEEGWVNNRIAIKTAERYLKPLKENKIDVLVLGCTHYPLFQKTIKKIIGDKANIVNPAESAARKIKQFLKENPDINSQIKKGRNHQFFFSDEPYNFEKISRLCFNKNIKIKIYDPFSG